MMPTYSINGRPVGIAKRRASLVRDATADDLPGIVTIHQKAFSNFFRAPRHPRRIRVRLCGASGILQPDVAQQGDLRTAGAVGFDS
jgi:hypothetical protein